MPPLAVVGYGIATHNMPVGAGAFALFVTNFVTIALSATAMARFYGFGHRLSRRQSWAQTIILLLVFVGMAIPLGISLNRIGREAVATSQARSLLTNRFGTRARVTQLDLDFDGRPLVVRAVVITPRDGMQPVPMIQAALAKALGRRVHLDLDQILLAPGADALAAQREELRQATAAPSPDIQQRTMLTTTIALAAGVSVDDVTIDRDHHRATAIATLLPGASLATYRSLELRTAAQTDGRSVAIVPPQQPLPTIVFGDDSAVLDPTVQAAITTSAWAAKRWNVGSLAVPGLPVGTPAAKPTLAARRGMAIAEALRADGVAAVAAPAAGQRFALVPALSQTAP